MRKRNILIGAVVVVAALAVLGAIEGGGTSPPTASTSGPTATPQNRPDAGTIWFGTAIASDLTMASHADTFAQAATIGWVAVLSDTPNDTSIKLTLAQQASGGAETVVRTTSVPVSDPQDNVLGHTPDDTLGLLDPGTYVLRYIRAGDAKVLATGTVTITP